MTTQLWSAVTRSIWNDDRFLGLSAPPPNAQTLWLYLLTTPHNTSIPGLIPVGTGAISDDLDWDPKDVDRFLGELETAEMLQRSKRPALIFLPNSIRHNPPKNPNQIKGWANSFGTIPDTPLRQYSLGVLREGLRANLLPTFDRVFNSELARIDARSKKRSQTVPKQFANGMGNQEQEQEYIPTTKLKPQNEASTKAKSGGETKVKKQSRPGAPKREVSTDAIGLAEKLRDAIETHSPEHVESKIKPATIQMWAVDIDRMLRLDKAKPEEVDAVIRWAHVDDRTGFWQGNLLSAKALRKHYTRLLLQVRRHSGVKSVAGAAGWKAEYGQWAIRVAARSVVSRQKQMDGDYLTEAAKLEGIPLPTPSDAESIAAWASSNA